MLEEMNKERKQKNWKIVNSFTQEDHQNNKSSFVEQPKKYCPRKNSSKEKIFSKSKERFNSFAIENTYESEKSHKVITEHKLKTAKSIPYLPNKNVVDQGVQTNKNLFSEEFGSENYFQSFNNSRVKLSKVSEKENKKGSFDKEGTFCKKNNPEIIFPLEHVHSKMDSFGNIMKNKKMMLGDIDGIKVIREEFENFKLHILDELNRQKQYISDLIEEFFIKSSTLLSENKLYLKEMSYKQQNEKFSPSKQYSEVEKWSENEHEHENFEENENYVNTSFSDTNELNFYDQKQTVKESKVYHSKMYDQNLKENESHQEHKIIDTNSHLDSHLENHKFRIPYIETSEKKKYLEQNIKERYEKKDKNNFIEREKFNEAIKKLKTNLSEITSIGNINEFKQINPQTTNFEHYVSQNCQELFES